MRIVSVAQMIELEKEANSKGLTYEEMMSNAGEALADIIHNRYFLLAGQHVLGLVGSGNNGGDALVALRYLAQKGWHAQAYLVKERDLDDPLIKALHGSNCEILHAENDKNLVELKKWTRKANVLVDGILGTGVRLPLNGDVQQVLKTVKSSKEKAVIIAVDCPSGVDCDSGNAADECLKADLTVCMAAVKSGLLKFPANNYVGEICCAEIGLPRSLSSWGPVNGEVLNNSKVADLLPERFADSHKGTYGTCMIVAGSVNYCGAVKLASLGAYLVGTGLVRAAIPGEIYDALAGHFSEVIWLVLPHTDGVINKEAAKLVLNNLDRITSLLIGPGLGAEDETREFLSCLLEGTSASGKNPTRIGFSIKINGDQKPRRETLPPLVVDADGLRLLAEIHNWEKKIPIHSILTPHPGEMSILTDMPIGEIQQNRTKVALKFSEKWGHIVILKGAMTIIANPEGYYAVVPFASSALATAGTGDVLAGMIAGLLAQNCDPFSAAKAAAWLHAKAGLIAAERIGNQASVIASDVAAAVPLAIKATTGMGF